MSVFCSKCGREMEDGSAFCPACGTPVLNMGQNNSDPVNNVLSRALTMPRRLLAAYFLSITGMLYLLLALFLPFLRIGYISASLIEQKGYYGYLFLPIAIGILLGLFLKKNLVYSVFSFVLLLYGGFIVILFSSQNAIKTVAGFYFLIAAMILNTAGVVIKAIYEKRKGAVILFGIGTGLFLIAVIVLNNPDVKYSMAGWCFDNGMYDRSASLYSSLGSYEDAADKAAEASLAKEWKAGMEQMDKGNYGEAIAHFVEADEYRDSADMIKKCHFEEGVKALDSGDLTGALEQLKNAEDYEGTREKLISLGIAMAESGDYKNALEAFSNVKNDMDEDTKRIAHYCSAKEFDARKNYIKAIEYFEKAGDVYDAKDMVKEEKYLYAADLMDDYKYGDAKKVLEDIKDYKDSENLYAGCDVMKVSDLISKGELNTAKKEIESLPDSMSYGGKSVAAMKKLLSDNEQYLKLCGKWVSTGGEIKTERKGSYGYHDSWGINIKDESYDVTVLCILSDDGKVSIECNGYIDVFNNFSSIKAYLDYQEKHVVKYVDGFGTYDVGDNTSITLDEHGVRIKYEKTEMNYSSFKDVYTTDITYSKRTEAL